MIIYRHKLIWANCVKLAKFITKSTVCYEKQSISSNQITNIFLNKHEFSSSNLGNSIERVGKAATKVMRYRNLVASTPLLTVPQEVFFTITPKISLLKNYLDIHTSAH